MSRKRVPLNQNECTDDFRIGVPFEQNLQSEMKVQEEEQKEIPKETTSDAEAEQKEETAASNHMSYTIQPGDTMTRISMKNYGTIKKIKEICELNQMSENDTIYPGQKILLP